MNNPPCTSTVSVLWKTTDNLAEVGQNQLRVSVSSSNYETSDVSDGAVKTLNFLTDTNDTAVSGSTVSVESSVVFSVCKCICDFVGNRVCNFNRGVFVEFSSQLSNNAKFLGYQTNTVPVEFGLVDGCAFSNVESGKTTTATWAGLSIGRHRDDTSQAAEYTVLLTKVDKVVEELFRNKKSTDFILELVVTLDFDTTLAAP